MWIRPSPERKRPYHRISDDPEDIQDMLDSEESPAHLVVFNYQHKPVDWLLAQLQAEGYDPYCFQSILVNGMCQYLGSHLEMLTSIQVRAEFTVNQKNLPISMAKRWMQMVVSDSQPEQWRIPTALHQTVTTR